jgi:Ca2+-binding EF-hand superfamily protein
MSIRGLGRVFRILDDNRNRQIEVKELQWGLKDFGIDLDDEMSACILAHFDKDNSGTVSFDEFLREMRGDLNANRLALIRKAYDKLDVNKDGSVKLDDIAKIYDVSQHPDVISGKL